MIKTKFEWNEFVKLCSQNHERGDADLFAAIIKNGKWELVFDTNGKKWQYLKDSIWIDVSNDILIKYQDVLSKQYREMQFGTTIQIGKALKRVLSLRSAQHGLKFAQILLQKRKGVNNDNH